MIARVRGGIGFVYLVWAGPCANRDCPVNISADQGHAHVGQFAVTRTDWSMSSASITHQPLEAGAGVGDALAIPEAIDIAASGEEAGYVGVVARPVRLERGLSGLLLDAHGGFEHLKRWHELWVYRADKRQLDKVWEYDEGSGPTWSSVAIVPRPDDTDQLVLFAAFDWSDYSDKPDSFTVTGLAWNGRKLVDRAPPPVWAVVAKDFATVGEARAESGCLGPAWVLPARRFGATEKAVVARPGLSQDDAERVARESLCPGRQVVVRRMK